MPIEMPVRCHGCGDIYELNDLVQRTDHDDLVCVGCRNEWLDLYGSNDEECE